jgi:hypothetical protein
MKTNRVKIKIGIVLVFVSFLTFACDKKESPESKSQDLKLNCIHFKNAILSSDETSIRQEMSEITKDLIPEPTADDKWGHQKNFSLLIDRLNQCDEINATLFCYCCIKTYPLQSEIIINTSSNGQQIQKIFDISTSEDSVLIYLGMHDPYN